MSRVDELIAEHAPEGVESKTLGDVGQFVRGNGLQKSDLTDVGASAIHYGQVHTHYGVWADTTKSFTDPEYAGRLRRAKYGDLVIATTSEDDAAVAKATAWLGTSEAAVSGDAYIYRHELDPKYVAYFFGSTMFQDQKVRHITGTKVRRVSGDALAKIRIPVPHIEVQREIVRILDQFTRLEAELEVELEAELEARRRQYEHYKSALLVAKGNAESVAIESHIAYVRGLTYSKADEVDSASEGIAVLRSNNIDLGSNRLNFDDVRLVGSAVRTRPDQWLKRNDILLSAGSGSRAHVGKAAFITDDMDYKYVQLFVISNGTLTKYYSNTTRTQHISEGKKQTKGRKTSNSFEFTSWWADAQNKPITDLTSFAKTFFAKHTLLNILTRYCVLTADRLLLVMRPYQIVATERILQRIDIATNYKQLGTVAAGGYVWHTTGSGKTLTSFKTAQLASKLPSVDKVLFVVDRKDLDYQTMREYDRFEKGAANSNTSTAVLKKQLENSNARIIITTIQKLSTFIKANKGHAITNDHVVIIFDECHRSQFGDMHTDITRAFKRYNLFGFTGTPIFAVNAGAGGNPQLKTTEQAFGEKLHTYTIVDAITDKNVLPFRIDYVNTVKVGTIVDKQVSAIDTEKALLAPERISQVVKYTLEHFDQKTKRSSSYEHSVVTNVADSTRARRQAEAVRERKRVRGFNAIFATASIDAARRYYNHFQIQQEALPAARRLKIGLIYSYGANDASDDGILDDEAFDTDALSMDARGFLEDAIQDYNDIFGTSYDTSADKFQNYYKDLSQRLKNRELDLVIVVNMFLTGFDATTLNTLFVDKNLRAHGLIQAYSRTNRILNSVKTYGNIVAFRDLEEETNAALELFGNKDARGIVLLKPYGDYYGEYAEKVDELLTSFPLGQQIIGEAAQKDFIQLFGQILRLENILTSFDDFAGQEILTERQGQDYRSVYLDLYAEFRKDKDADKELINDDVVFEIELIKQVEINVDYILMLVQKYRSQHGDGEDKEIRAEISRAVDASPTLRNKKDLIEAFVDSVSVDGAIDEEWQAFIAAKREAELEAIIEDERLRADATRAFIDIAFRDGALRTTGTAITKVLPPASRFSADGGHGEKKQRVIEKLGLFFERFFGLSVNGVDE